MDNPKNLNPAVSLRGVAIRRTPVSHPILAIWHTMIGKKVVMAVTGIVLIGFVIGHVLGNLKIFAGPEQINAYSRFLREFGMPELGYGQLLWLVRIVLLVCVTLHITAAVQLTRMTMHGFSNTLSATTPMMALHTAAVARGAPSKFIVADLPFLSYRKGLKEAMDAVHDLMSAGAHGELGARILIIVSSSGFP